MGLYVSLLVHGSNSLSYFFSYLFSLVFLKLTVFLSERCSRPMSMYSCLSCITTVDPLSAFLISFLFLSFLRPIRWR